MQLIFYTLLNKYTRFGQYLKELPGKIAGSASTQSPVRKKNPQSTATIVKARLSVGRLAEVS